MALVRVHREPVTSPTAEARARARAAAAALAAADAMDREGGNVAGL